ncbi:glycosyltransferase [Croceiramulus getboli]|nr:glycosyltransferase [Flavobacteriaceae bacterium YJPT1-3]
MIMHLVVIGTVWPEPQSSAAGSRMLQILDVFKDAGWKITFASASGLTESFRKEQDILEVSPLTPFPEVDHWASILLNDASFDQQLQQWNPDAVLFDRFMTEEQYGWRVAEVCPQALRILDMEDLHSLRKERELALKAGEDFREERLLASKTAVRELASIWRCDLSLVISRFELDLLQRVFQVKAELLLYLPFMIKGIAQVLAKQRKPYTERKHFVTIGNFKHAPNADGVRYLKQQIWHHIRKALPEAEMHVYGAYASTANQQLHDPASGFLIKGHAARSAEVVEEGRLLLAPLRFGAGLKGKLVEAMLLGTPSVTTPIGAEGMYDIAWGGAIAQNAADFARAAVNLYQEEETWKEAQSVGYKNLQTHFQQEDHAQRLLERINSLQHRLNDHRRHNFVGQMLQHHRVQSTKYLSRWIEEKNKKN